MKTELYARLENAMQNFINRNCTNITLWDTFYIPENLNSLMSKAAASVYDACVKGQEEGIKEGCLKQL